MAFTDTVKVQPYDPFANGTPPYLLAVDFEIGFASQRNQSSQAYDQDALGKHVVGVFQNQILTPGQMILMDVASVPFKLTVRTISLGDLSGRMQPSEAQAMTDPTISGILLPQTQINFSKDAKLGANMNLKASNRRPATNLMKPNFSFEKMGIGGLDNEFAVILRRAFSSRILPPAVAEKLGTKHVKGILLHGPPGTGKTLIARQIGQMLNAHPPKVINGPEVLNKYVGQSEENVRKMFVDAEKEMKEKGEESGLHIIIFDELDAVCKQRGSGAGGGTGVGDSVVNQLLSKLDGVEQLNNILLIGMTNRKDMIDDALLRPGRLELHIEISLPDEAGRVQILNIHTRRWKENNILAHDVDIQRLAALTKNYSGAEIEGLCRSASSFATMRHIKVAGASVNVNEDISNIQVTMEDFMHALEEVHSAFGVAEAGLNDALRGGLLHYSSTVTNILRKGHEHAVEVRDDPDATVLSVLLHGPPNSGKTALAAKIALESEYPFVKLLSPIDMPGFSEAAKIDHINRVFTDAHKSPLSIILIDEIELIIDWNPIGPRFANSIVGLLSARLKQSPPVGRRLLIIGTTSRLSALDHLNLIHKFDYQLPVPNVRTPEELAKLLELSEGFSSREIPVLVSRVQESRPSEGEIGVGVKKVLDAIRTSRNARDEQDKIDRFADAMESFMTF